MKQQSNARGQSIVIERTYRASVADIWDLWTTQEGFESWWGPEGFGVEVHVLDARTGGELRYDMVARSPEMIAAMKQMGQPTSHPTSSRFTEVTLHKRLVLKQVRMIVTLDAMHSDEFTQMQKEGFTSQLTKLDPRFV
jgi:uncharacterized protein YndB with AHSA1/START domain